MPFYNRQQLPHGTPSLIPDGESFFITINCKERGENQLCTEGTGHPLLEAAKFNHDKHIWCCRLILLMPDHLHAIIIFSNTPGMKKIVTEWKRYVARETGVNWQRDFFDHRLRDHHRIEEKADYIMKNPVRKGQCEKPEDWPWVFRPVAKVD